MQVSDVRVETTPAHLKRWVVSILFLLFVSGCGGRGRMPSKSQAAAIRNDALAFLEANNTNQASKADLPESIVSLKPVRVEALGGGVLIVFRQRFVEGLGILFLS